jgi:hypothetical protein
MPEPEAIQVESEEDSLDEFRRDAVVDCPTDDVQVLFAGLELIEDRVEEVFAIVELALKKSEVAVFEFDPEALALKVFDPSRSQITRPVLFHPLADTAFTQVVAGFLALDPFVLVFFDSRGFMQTLFGDELVNPVVGFAKRVVAGERVTHGRHLRRDRARIQSELNQAE